MEKSNEYYKEHPIEFIEDLHSVKLLPYQKIILQKISENPNEKWVFYGGRMLGKRFTEDAIKDYRKLMRGEIDEKI